jgi:hypothetical protein
MLIQSYDGFIRLLPAVPAEWCGSFQLAAAGGFIVQGEFNDGRLVWAAIESKNGQVCRLVSPWPVDAAWLLVLDGNGNPVTSGQIEAAPPADNAVDRIMTFETQPGCLYLLSPDKVSLDSWQVEPASFTANQTMKKLGKVQLGLPRMF